VATAKERVVALVEQLPEDVVIELERVLADVAHEQDVKDWQQVSLAALGACYGDDEVEYTEGDLPVVAGSTFAGVATYLRCLPDDPMIKSVSIGIEGGSVWIVTEVEAEGSLPRLDPLFEAESAARASADVALIFRIVDRSIGEARTDGPRNVIPVR
jgi:hypothetical protein